DRRGPPPRQAPRPGEARDHPRRAALGALARRRHAHLRQPPLPAARRARRRRKGRSARRLRERPVPPYRRSRGRDRRARSALRRVLPRARVRGMEPPHAPHLAEVGRYLALIGYWITMPPSTRSTAPVIHLASSEARKTAARAMSSMAPTW